MRILVTGASGFIGAHIVNALIGAGHEVRAFVRSTDKLSQALRPFGVEPNETQVGDVTDKKQVPAAVADCDAVIHAANVYTYDPRKTDVMTRTNVEGTRLILDAAVAAGCDPIIHISTAQVTWPKGDGSDPLPLAPLQGHGYSDSKKRAEAVAREWQERGAPVVTTYPGGVFGPLDPGPGEQINILKAVLVPTAPFRIDGGFPACDVDWVTAVHMGLLEPGQGPRRVSCTGLQVSWDELFELARHLTGRPLPNPLPSPHWLLRGMGAVMNGLQRVVPGRLLFGSEQAWILGSAYALPDEEAIRIAGNAPPVEESIRTAIVWAVEAGHISAKQAGALAPTPS